MRDWLIDNWSGLLLLVVFFLLGYCSHDWFPYVPFEGRA